MKILLFGIFLSLNLIHVNFLFAQKDDIDSLGRILIVTKSDNLKYDLLIEIGQKYEQKSPISALKYYRQALDIAKKIEDEKLIANVLFNMGEAYDNSQKFNQAKELYKKSLNIYLKYNDSIHIADLYKNIGQVFLMTSVYDSAMYYELKAIRIYQHFNNIYGVMYSYQILGTLSSEIENYIEAEFYFEKALKFADETNNSEYKCSILNSIGYSFEKQKYYDLALQNYWKALEIAKKENLKIYLGGIYQNIANTYLSMNQIHIALTYFYKAKEVYEEFNNIKGVFAISLGLARLYYNAGYYRISYGFLLKAKSIKKSYNSYLTLKNNVEFYDVYSKILYKINKPQKAYNALINRNLYQDSFFGEDKIKLVYELEFKYQTISKNKTIKDLQEINSLNEQVLAKSEAKRKAEKKVAFLLVFIGLLSIIGSIIIYFNFLKNRKLSKKIQEKNKKIFEAQEKLKRIVDFLPVVFFEANYKGQLIFKNQNFSELTTIKSDFENFYAYLNYIKPEYHDNVIEIINELIKTGDVQTVEFEFERDNGTSFWALLTIALNEFNGKKEFYGMMIDISERKKIELDLLLLKTSVEQSESPLMITDSSPKIVYVNSAYLTITGYTEDELVGKNPSVLKSNETPQTIYEQLWEVISSGKVWRGIFINKKKNGQYFSDKSIITPVKNKRGIITHYVANKEDITEEVIKNEKILKLFTATENSPNSVIILDENMKITYANKSFEKITGYAAEEVIGLNPSFLDSGKHDTEFIEILRETVYSGKIWQGMIINKRKNGEEYWNSSTVIPLHNEDKLIGFVCNDTDITAQIKTQEELMDTMDQLNEKNQEIFSSIRYAERIQKVMMSNENEIEELFPLSFVIYLPRDIISGDFFWVSKIQNKYFAAIVDCTGHSVPGAFLSIIGVNLLDLAINERRIENPAEVIKFMSEKLLGILTNPYTLEHIKDDMEVALVQIDYDTKQLLFASSRNRMYYISEHKRSNIIEEGVSILHQNGKSCMYKYNGDREFLGSMRNEKSFKSYKVDLKNNDIIYFSSDGFYDQFGGKDNVKYKRKKFEQKLFEISDFDMIEQKNILLDEFEEFKGSYPQTDDITILGIKFEF